MISCPTRGDRTRRIWRTYLPYKFFIFHFLYSWHVIAISIVNSTSLLPLVACHAPPLSVLAVSCLPALEPHCNTTIGLRLISTRSLHVLFYLPGLSQHPSPHTDVFRDPTSVWCIIFLKTCDEMGLGVATRGLQLLPSGSRRSWWSTGILPFF